MRGLLWRELSSEHNMVMEYWCHSHTDIIDWISGEHMPIYPTWNIGVYANLNITPEREGWEKLLIDLYIFRGDEFS